MSQCPSDFALDCYFVQGGSADDPVGLHVRDCTHCSERIQEREKQSQDFATILVKRTDLQLTRPRPRTLRWWPFPILAVAGTAALALIIGTHNAARPYRGAKGGEQNAVTAVTIFCRRAERVFALQPGDPVAAGDALRFAVRASNPRQRFVLVGSLDGDGHFSVFYPSAEGAASIELPNQGALPGSVVLDGARGPERFLVITSERPIMVADVRAAVNRGRDLSAEAATKTGTVVWIEHPKTTQGRGAR